MGIIVKGKTTLRGSTIIKGETPAGPSAKISILKTSDNSLIYENDSINDIMTYLGSYTATFPITVQFNDSTTHQPTSGSITIPAATNGSNLVTFKAKSGFSPVIDGQLLSSTVITFNGSNVTWDGIDVINAYTSNSDDGGTIIRLNGSKSNLTIKNCLLKRGLVGIRGTTDITGITIENVVVEEVNLGCIRIGGGFFSDPDMYEDFDLRDTTEYDLHDVLVKNITCLDTLSGGNVPGTTQPFSALIIIKRTENLTVQNTKHDCLTDGHLIIEDSTNVSVDRILSPTRTSGGYGIGITGSDFVTVSNSFIKSVTGSATTLLYFNIVRNIKLIHNTFVGVNQFDSLNTQGLRRILKVVGNLTSFDYYGPFGFNIATTVNGVSYTASMANDFQEEHDNVLWNNNEYEDLLYVSGVLSGSDLKVRKSNTFSGAILDSTYRSTYSGYGVNSSFQDLNLITLATRTNPDSSTSGPYYLGASESSTYGRNMITSSVDSLAATDCAGYTRTYSTDAGAFDRDATTLS